MVDIAVIGCGYTGREAARRWQSAGARVTGFAASPSSLEAIRGLSIEARALDLDSGLPLRPIHAELVLYCVPPPNAGSGDLRLARCLTALQDATRRIIYLSTTGVYGNQADRWVSEDTPLAPTNDRAQRRVAAEGAIRYWADARSVSWVLLRVAGIYGPGRLPLDRLRRAEPAIRHEEANPGNRIHVQDLAQACIAAAALPVRRNGIYNIADGNHESATAFLERVARLSGLPTPPLISREEARRRLSAVAMSFLDDSRRIDNRRMREELGVQLAFADPDAGIRASLI
jgi:nucleoside-diphosphate-sugar epimerase